MMSKVKKFFNDLKYMFAFGLKGGDDVIQQHSDDASISIVQQQETQNLGEALLKGEVTQQVENLRHSTYYVDRESTNYKYVANGVAEKKILKHGTKYKFKQLNKQICEDVLHELNRIGKYGERERYTFDITYDTIPRFRIEPFITLGEFKVKQNEIQVTFWFDRNIINDYDILPKLTLKELDKITRISNPIEYTRNEICSSVKVLNFTTLKAEGEEDMMLYILQDLQFVSCLKDDNFYYLTYKTDKFEITDLIKKFYSKQQDEKYKNKDAKSIQMFAEERKAYCSVCGKEMNVYDADITINEYGKPICVDCLKEKKQ